MTKEELEAAKAAFLAKGNQITVVKEGEGAGLTAREWYSRLRGNEPRPTTEQEAENRFQRGVEENGYYKS